MRSSNTHVDALHDRITANLTEARNARRRGDWELCWQLLEDAHILSQPWALPHVRVHAAMLLSGARRWDLRETAGQFLRLIVGGPASALGRYPIGNTGRARVSPLLPMPIRPDLADLLTKAGKASS